MEVQLSAGMPTLPLSTPPVVALLELGAPYTGVSALLLVHTASKVAQDDEQFVVIPT